MHDEVWLSSSPAVDVPPPLEFMRLNEAWRAHDFVDIQRFLQRRRENFLLIGDSAVLYGATRRPSIFPVLWMHRGVTIPGIGQRGIR